MIELGKLEDRHEDFAKRNTRIVAVSLENTDESKKTQNDFPHLTVVSDPKLSLISVADVIHRHSAQDGGDTAAPATILIDNKGKVRWTSRPDSFLTRLP